KLLKFANRYQRFALVAAEEALSDAGIRPDERSAPRWSCVVGSGMMGVDFHELGAVHRRFAPDGVFSETELFRAGTAAADPLVFCRSQSNAGLSLLLQRFGIRGYASTVHTACASGGQAIGTALQLIRRGTADRVLAGGFDSMIDPVGLAAFC